MQFMTLASRGGRNSTSTEFRLLGGQITIGGLHRPPFLFRLSLSSSVRVFVCKSTAYFKVVPQKSERPVGVPAALAWGMEGLLRKLNPSLERQVVPLRSQAAEQHTGARSL